MKLAEEVEVLANLLWKKFPVLNDGFVCLVDVMGSDADIVQAARVSFGNDARKCAACGGTGWTPNNEPNPDADTSEEDLCTLCDGKGHERPETAKKGQRDLIRYLMRHRHSTPFEMCEIKLLVRVPMDTWRQWIRHRTASVNEYSTRYTKAIDSCQTTLPGEWRLQSTDNKQGSSGFLDAGSSIPNYANGVGSEVYSGGQKLTNAEAAFHEAAHALYQERLDMGIAKEQARKDLPLSTYTEAYWKIDLHNLFHFLGLRMDSHAQLEIRQFATIIGEQIVKPLFPLAWEAFEDYRLGAMYLTRLDIEALKFVRRASDMGCLADSDYVEEFQRLIPNDRERKECLAKLKKLTLIGEDAEA